MAAQKEKKMRFHFTMNMPARSGNQVHMIVADHPSNSLDEVTSAMNENDFIIVEEFYKAEDGSYFSKGEITLNCLMIGKVKVPS